MAQQVKDLALSQRWPGLLLWHRFSPWPGNFHMPWVRKKKKDGDINSLNSHHNVCSDSHAIWVTAQGLRRRSEQRPS